MTHAPTKNQSSSGYFSSDSLTRLNVPIGRVCCERCVALVEQQLRQNPQVRRVHTDAAAGVAHVDVDNGTTSVAELSTLVGDCCGERSPVPLPDAAVSSHSHIHMRTR